MKKLQILLFLLAPLTALSQGKVQVGLNTIPNLGMSWGCIDLHGKYFQPSTSAVRDQRLSLALNLSVVPNTPLKGGLLDRADYVLRGFSIKGGFDLRNMAKSELGSASFFQMMLGWSTNRQEARVTIPGRTYGDYQWSMFSNFSFVLVDVIAGRDIRLTERAFVSPAFGISIASRGNEETILSLPVAGIAGYGIPWVKSSEFVSHVKMTFQLTFNFRI